jgi:uncharacterized membrane protein
MSEFENQPGTFSGSSAADLQEEVHSLRTLLSVSLILMIVFGLSVNLFLLKQVSALGTQTTLFEQQADQGARNFNTAKAIEFWNRLVAYSRAHPEYAPVINDLRPALGYTLIGNPGAAK